MKDLQRAPRQHRADGERMGLGQLLLSFPPRLLDACFLCHLVEQGGCAWAASSSDEAQGQRILCDRRFKASAGHDSAGKGDINHSLMLRAGS